MNKKSTYTHLTQSERQPIEVQLKQEVSLSAIAKGRGRSKATLSRELKRNARSLSDFAYFEQLKYKALINSPPT
jgi:IS30 family transposase